MSISDLFPQDFESKFERMWNANSFPPHHSKKVLAIATVGRSTYRVESNRTSTRWWYQEIGDGLAGEGCSRHDWACTSSPRKAATWITAVQSIGS